MEKTRRQEGRKSHLEGGTLLTARVKGTSREFIKIYNSKRYTEGVKDLRKRSVYLMLQKWR